MKQDGYILKRILTHNREWKLSLDARVRERRANKEGGNFWLNFELFTSLYTFMAAPTRTILRNLSSDDGDFNENDIKAISLYWQNMHLCTCITLFGTLHCRHCTTTTRKRRENATTTSFLFLNFDTVFLNSTDTPEKTANI